MRTILLPVAFLAALPAFAGRTVTALDGSAPYVDKVASAGVQDVPVCRSGYLQLSY